MINKFELFNIADKIDLILILLMKYIFIYGYFLKSFDQNFAYNLPFIPQYLSRPRRRKASVKGIHIKVVKAS